MPDVVPNGGDTESATIGDQSFPLHTKRINRKTETVRLVVERINKNSEGITSRVTEISLQRLNHIVTWGIVIANTSDVEIVVVVSDFCDSFCESPAGVIREDLEEIVR